MITNKDLSVVNLSTTKKDFYQIWNELLDTASKISNRWDPTSTNESDPGIVLLKVLTAVADKLNYNIDKNILEAFMPSAAQRESMMKLCAMMGYNMKYYQSAETKVHIAYNGVDTDGNTISLPDDGLVLPKFTNITDTDKKINYVTMNAVHFIQDPNVDEANAGLETDVSVCEGQYVQCETDNNNLITLQDLDDENRYYLPETMIAENGIFIDSIDANNRAIEWEQVDNLNSQRLGIRVYQFGFDSKEGKAFVKFPDDVGQLILNGLTIAYLRTSGVNGNISANTLTTFTAPSDASWDNYQDVDTLFDVTNAEAATNGANPETITQAYNAYKRTIGTFDTLITCRDYMNKIYNLLDDKKNPLISNVLVTDIRSDLNRAYTLCTYNDYGILYEEKPYKLNQVTDEQSKNDNTSQDNTSNNNGTAETDVLKEAISQFDLILYPFKTYKANLLENYEDSFKCDTSMADDIVEGIADIKAIPHNIRRPGSTITLSDKATIPVIAAIKNYLKLDARISTTTKVNKIEETNILNNIKTAIYSAFNARQLDFGEEIPFDSILNVIQNADTRIKTVSLEEPALYTAFLSVDNKVYSAETSASTGTSEAFKNLYVRLAVRNILAGRLSLFNYYTEFKPELTQATYEDEAAITKSTPSTGEPAKAKPAKFYGSTLNNLTLTNIESECNIPLNADNYTTLSANEVIRFKAPSYKTSVTYPAYVNYYLHLNATEGSSSNNNTAGIPAQMEKFTDYLYRTINRGENGMPNGEDPAKQITLAEAMIRKYLNLNNWTAITTNNYTSLISNNIFEDKTNLINEDINKVTNINENDKLAQLKQTLLNKYLIIIKKSSTRGISIIDFSNFNISQPVQGEAIKYYALRKSAPVFANFIDPFIRQTNDTNNDNTTRSLYWKGTEAKYMPGKLVDALGYKYQLLSLTSFIDSVLTENVVQNQLYINIPQGEGDNGLGSDAAYDTIKANAEYKLKSGDYLCINYTKASNGTTTETSATTTNTATQASEIINNTYGAGTVINPNFDLVDSEKYHLTHSYSKTSGFTFDGNIATIPPEGMFTMASNEQIAIREPAEISFGTKLTGKTESLVKDDLQLYWTLNEKSPEFTKIKIYDSTESLDNVAPEYKSIVNIFSQTPDFDTANATRQIYKYSYTLKEGEYLYYTNSLASSLAYYGAGTEIVIYSNINNKECLWLDPANNDNIISASEVMEKGLKAVPWKKFSFGYSNNEFSLLQLKEYRYIDLTAGDSIKGKLNDTAEATITTINKTYQAVSKLAIANLRYRIGGGEEQTLPNLDYGAAPTDNTWEVRSYLALNVGPQVTQTLQPGRDSITLTYSAFNEDTNEISNSTTNITLAPSADNNDSPLSIRTTLPLQASEHSDFGKLRQNLNKVLAEDSTNTVAKAQLEALNNFKQEVFLSTPITAVSESSPATTRPITLISMANGLTKFSLADLIDKRKNADGADVITKYALNFHISLPVNNDTNYNGLMLFYYAPAINENATEGTNEKTANPYLTLVSTRANESSAQTQEAKLHIFNYPNETTPSWWTGYTAEVNNTENKVITHYILKEGMNIICIPESGILSLTPGTSEGIVVYSSLDIINNNINGLNPELGFNTFNWATDNSANNLYTNILSIINVVDPNHEFFYNCPISPDLAISFGGDASDVQTLADPAAWYDPNNINNNFVISEIDAKYLDTGIKLTNSSKL